MKSLQTDIDTFFRLLKSPIHISWSTTKLFADYNSRFRAYENALRRDGKKLTEMQIVYGTFKSGCSPALLLNYALKCLGKTRDDLKFFQKPVLPYVGHVVYGSPHSACKKVLYLCEKNAIANDTKWEDVEYNPFALRLSLRRDQYDFEKEIFDVVLATLDDAGNVLRVSKGNCVDVQNCVHQTAHYHRNWLRLCTPLINAEFISLYKKCESVSCIVMSNLLHLVGQEKHKRLHIDVMILNDTDCLWQRVMFVKKIQDDVYVRPQVGWTNNQTTMWQKSVQLLVAEMAQLILLDAGKVESNWCFLPELLALVCDDIVANDVRQLLLGVFYCGKPRLIFQRLFARFFAIAERESEKNLSRSSTPNTSPLRNTLARCSPRSSPLRCRI